MSDNTQHLNLPYLMPSQAQKHVTHNDALSILDDLSHLCVLSRALVSNPTNALEGQRYLIPTNAQGEWENYQNMIARFADGNWKYYSPSHGWLCFVEDEKKHLVFDGTDWIGSPSKLESLGINTLADSQNRLSVASANTLLSHDGGDHRLAINKASSGDTASIIFQDGYSGHCEIGLTGSNNTSIRVSNDGQSWKDVLVIDRQAAVTVMPNRPYFRASLNAPIAITSITSPLKFGVALDDNGNNYDITNFKFTAPISGIYLFCATVRLDSLPSSAYARLYFKRNNLHENYTLGHVIDGNNHSSDFHSMSISSALNLTTGDTISIHGGHSTGAGFLQNESSWSGVFLG